MLLREKVTLRVGTEVLEVRGEGRWGPEQIWEGSTVVSPAPPPPGKNLHPIQKADMAVPAEFWLSQLGVGCCWHLVGRAQGCCTGILQGTGPLHQSPWPAGNVTSARC